DTVAAAEGLLAAGASDVIVVDNHGSGNPENVSGECLPAGARLETWNVFDLAAHDVDAIFQVGYHARGGVDGFISHTYVPGLRLRVDGELISESHGRAWAAGVPLVGIAGNDSHRDTLGSLAETPFLVVQESRGRNAMRPVFADPAEGLRAIRDFAAECLRGIRDAARVAVPAGVTFEASMPNGAEQVETMEAAGWRRVGDVEYAVDLRTWSDARAPLQGATGAAAATLMPYWVGATSAAEAAAADPDRVAAFTEVMIDRWCTQSFPEWFTEPGLEIRPPAG
ncbi:MAG: M55 family metallopeptidase, partial [Gaiellales bacterium]